MRIGTRGSPLALKQAQIVKNLLVDKGLYAPEEIELIPIKTSGDKITDVNLDEFGGKGLFTKEIEVALFDNVIDIAVHSMKDVATVTPDGLSIPCVLPREDVRDAFISYKSSSIETLPLNAKFGTSSLRRAAQVLCLRPDLQIVNFRGNIDTRLKKLNDGVADATLLACAGLIRAGQESVITQRLSTEQMLPAVAQGALGIQCRTNDEAMLEILDGFNHADSHDCIDIEREFLLALDGSCRMPIAGLAIIDGDNINFEGLVAAKDGSKCHRKRFTCQRGDAMKQSYELGLEMKGLPL